VQISRYFQSCSTANRLLLLLCSTALLGFAATGCSDDSGVDCPPGQQAFDELPGGGKCAVPCETDSDCPDGFSCRSATACLPDDNRDTMVPDGGTPDTGTDDDTGNGNDTGPSGDKSCDQLRTCTTVRCAPDDDECEQSRCLDQAESQGEIDSLDTLEQCIADNNCNADDASPRCTVDNCETQLRQCGAVDDEESAGEVFKCQQTCQTIVNSLPDDTDPQQARNEFADCVNDCPDGTVDAQKQVGDFQACAANNCGGNNPPPGCLPNQCESELDAAGLLGENSCAEAREAQLACGMGDARCTVDASWSLTADARVNQAELGACTTENCPDDAQGLDLLLCELNECVPEKEACNMVGDERSSCSGLFQCIQDRECMSLFGECDFGCYHDSSVQAQKDWFNYIQCVGNNDNCTLGDTCSACQDVSEACVGTGGGGGGGGG